jgi:hypothetical protein
MPINWLIGADGERMIDAGQDCTSVCGESRIAKKIQSFSQENIKCAKARSMKGVSTRFLTMEALKADSLASKMSRWMG